MLCDNCGKKEANVRYLSNVNGVKRELNLCEECSQKLGITDINFNMPIDFSSFFEDFLEDFTSSEYMPLFNEVKNIKCESCGYTFEDIANTGKFGCGNCYKTFEDRIDPILKRIQGANKHVGRLGKVLENHVDMKAEKTDNEKQNEQDTKLQKLQEELKHAIKEERYEDAAKLRDEIKKIEKR